jgi:hypothetical protein
MDLCKLPPLPFRASLTCYRVADSDLVAQLRHRMSSKPGLSNYRGMHRRVGPVQRTYPTILASAHEFTLTIEAATKQHAFHFHCISRWLKTRQVCPLDNREWELQK